MPLTPDPLAFASRVKGYLQLTLEISTSRFFLALGTHCARARGSQQCWQVTPLKVPWTNGELVGEYPSPCSSAGLILSFSSWFSELASGIEFSAHSGNLLDNDPSLPSFPSLPCLISTMSSVSWDPLSHKLLALESLSGALPMCKAWHNI